MSKKGILRKDYVSGLVEAGHSCTVLGVGPVSEVLVREGWLEKNKASGLRELCLS